MFDSHTPAPWHGAPLTPFSTVTTSSPEPMPRLSDRYEPPVAIGTAALVTAAMQGAGIDQLIAMVGRLDIHPAAAMYDTAILYQIAQQRSQALALQDAALAVSPLVRVRRDNPAPAALRLLALVAPGDMMMNTPLDFITSHIDVRLDLLFLIPGQPLPKTVPDHDVMFFAASEPDAATLARMQRLFASWPRPVLNNPAALPGLARDRLAASLAGLNDICSPATRQISRAELDDVLAGRSVGDILPGCGYPVLIRPIGSHAGIGLEKIDDLEQLSRYVSGSDAADYFVSQFVDYRAADGLYRKYRIAFIGGQPQLCHMAASQHWMVHYLNASMAEHAARRDDEAHAMATFDTGFAARHQAAFAALNKVLRFDYYSVDCGELPDGRLVVFEADTAAIIHLMDPIEMFPYKHVQMRRVFQAFGDLLHRSAPGSLAA
jgi:hypothetical protein